MAKQADASTRGQALADRPGWTELQRAAEELHAAEILLQDPVAPLRTTLPHLRAFWASVASAAQAFEASGPAQPRTPADWLAGDAPIAGVDAKLRQALAGHHGSLGVGEDELEEEALLVHVRDARRLLAGLEPELGGRPLRRRRLRLAIASVSVALLLGPLLAYTATRTEVPGTGPWRSSYYPDRMLESKPTVVREDDIDHDWDDRPPLEDIPPDKFSAQFDTCLLITEPVEAVFQVNANDGARVLVGGELIIDAWERDGKTRRRGFGSGFATLEPGVHHLRVEYFESLGKQSIYLVASLDGGVPQSLSRDVLRYPGDLMDEDDPCASVSLDD